MLGLEKQEISEDVADLLGHFTISCPSLVFLLSHLPKGKIPGFCPNILSCFSEIYASKLEFFSYMFFQKCYTTHMCFNEKNAWIFFSLFPSVLLTPCNARTRPLIPPAPLLCLSEATCSLTHARMRSLTPRNMQLGL